jgi:alkylation response protein AidB-like acyl-CoA dehydrogenase
MLKIRGTELRQAIFETLLDIGGPQALPFSAQAQFSDCPDDQRATAPELATLAANALDARKLSIYGGSNEVQRNLIAQALLSA